MKKSVILVIFLVIFSSVSFAKVVDVPKVSEGSGEEISMPLVQEEDEIIRYYYSGSSLVYSSSGEEERFYFQDRLGSNRISVNSEGDVKNFKSLPYGQVIQEGIQYGFTGKEKDESGLYYFGARYYDSDLGKFTSVDPVASELPYAYVSNNPMMLVDPSGMFDQTYLSAGDDIFTQIENYVPDPEVVGSISQTDYLSKFPMNNPMNQAADFESAVDTGATVAGVATLGIGMTRLAIKMPTIIRSGRLSLRALLAESKVGGGREVGWNRGTRTYRTSNDPGGIDASDLHNHWHTHPVGATDDAGRVSQSYAPSVDDLDNVRLESAELGRDVTHGIITETPNTGQPVVMTYRNVRFACDAEKGFQFNLRVVGTSHKLQTVANDRFQPYLHQEILNWFSNYGY
jgi:RHS repeat-associated protein